METKNQNKRHWICPLITLSGRDLATLIIRAIAGFMLLRHGIDKVNNFDTLINTFPDPIGLGSKLSLMLITATEVGASLFIMAGFMTRLAAFAIMFGMGTAAFIVHQPFTINTSELPLLYLAIAIFLLIAGAGRYSADELLRKKLCE